MFQLQPSGINVIDEKVGGLYNSSTYLVTGNTGTGKSILGLQFILKGIALNQNGLLVTDEKPKDVILQAENLGLDIRNAISGGNLVILELNDGYPSQARNIRDLKDVYGELSEYIEKYEIKRVVIDGFKSIFLPNNDIQLAKESLPYFFTKLCDGELTTVITADITHYQYSDEAKLLLEKLASGIIHLHQIQSESVRHMIIRKMKGQSVDLKPFNYSFEKTRGIVGKA